MNTPIIHNGKRHEIDSSFSLWPLIGAWKAKDPSYAELNAEEASFSSHTMAADKLPDSYEEMSKVFRLIQSVYPSSLLLHHGNESKNSLHVPFEDLESQPGNAPAALRDCLNNGTERETFRNDYQAAYYLLACELILEQLYGISLHLSKNIVCKSADPETSLSSYTELILDRSFIKVECKTVLPHLSKSQRRKLALNGCPQQVEAMLPSIENFAFSGMMLISARDVTHREISRRCKLIMVGNESFPDKSSIAALRAELQSITGLTQIETGILLKKEYCSVETCPEELIPGVPAQAIRSLFNNHEITSHVQAFFEKRTELLISDVSTISYRSIPMVNLLQKAGVKSLLIYPLIVNAKLIGLFGVMSKRSGMIRQAHANIIEPLVEILSIAMERSVERLETRIDKIIKEEFTAVQSSVDWKFREVALGHLQSGSAAKKAKIEKVSFDNVFPLYGSIDVRNSSIVRMQAVQQDLVRQLKMAAEIIGRAIDFNLLPLLGEIKFRLDKYIDSVSIMLFPGDEITIQQYLQEQVARILKHLAMNAPFLQDSIEHYFEQTNTNSLRLNTKCSEFDDSIKLINKELTKFLDEEQQKVQQVYPHYFERFVTDGIDFNIYIGQSIAPSKPFEEFYLQNLKLWQLTTLINGAKLTCKLSRDLPVPLQTTQLILAHSKPINISFRSEERKFDVDGAYNIHYEIIKKRIDKVRIRETDERLTQPGTIAIVYSQPSEGVEYLGYLEYLQMSGLVTGDIERLDLEELRGVVGLKALRVRIVLESASEIIASAFKGETIPQVMDGDQD
jgi:hypothetical protein